jgi:hypothetical protein
MRNKSLKILTLLLAFGAEPVALAQQAADTMETVASPSSKRGRLRKLQIVNRAFQVSFGRGMRPAEAKKVAPMSKSQIIQTMLANEELTRVYAQRLAQFASNRIEPSASQDRRVSQAIRAIAKPTDKLEDVIKKLNARRHGGKLCAAKASNSAGNAACFATWLVGRVAPSLGQSWVDQRASQMGSWSYARLLEQITLSSL